MIERGDCTFTTKAQAVEAAGYQAGVVFNSDAAGNCEATVSMLVEGDIPMLFVPRSSGYAILGINGYNPGHAPAASTQPCPDRNTGLWIFQWRCEDVSDVLYCNGPVTP